MVAMGIPEQPKELIQDLNRSYELQLADHLSIDQLEALLAERINTMIRGDFGRLVQMLYRVDVNESKLRQLLRDNTGEDAGKIIAQLIIERQLQKIKTRQQFSKKDNDISEEEKW